jgi:Lysozyme like domain
VTFDELAALYVSAGGSPYDAPTMAALALAESSGNPGAICYDYKDAAGNVLCSPTPRPDAFQTDTGLWQIGSVHGYSIAQLMNPATNAAAAVAVRNSQGFGAWASYGTPKFRQILASHGGAAAGAGAIGAAPSSTSNLGTIAQSSSNVFVLLHNWIVNKNINVLYKTFLLCLVLIALGAIEQTARFANWAALCILFLLLVQKKG